MEPPMELDTTKAAIEDDRLWAELIEARLKMSALTAELNRATFSRLYPAQVKLVEAEKAARARWKSLFLALRIHRRSCPQFHTDGPSSARF